MAKRKNSRTARNFAGPAALWLGTIMKLVILSLLLAAVTRIHAESLTLHAGGHDRSGCVVTFQAPAAWWGKTLTLQELGMPVQVDEAGRGTFVLQNALPKGKELVCTIASALPAFAAGGVETQANEKVLTLVAKPYAGAAERTALPVFTYQMLPGPVPAGTAEGFAHGAHLHPVFSPSGRLLTGNHPSDHPHQRGIWFAWTHTEFAGGAPDFWNMGKDKTGKLTGEVRFDKLLKSWSGPVHGGFVSTHKWLDHTSGVEKDMLNETWEVTVTHTAGLKDGSGTPLPPLFLMDLVSTQTCAGAEPVKLPKYHYGGLGVRGNALWDPVEKVAMLTSNGDDRKTGDATKAKWVWLGGEVDGQMTGITVLMHPDNFRFPQPLRLNPKNQQICVAPSADGDWSIEPGQPYVSRYRLVFSDGKPEAQEMERRWTDYAEPPQVTITP